MDKRTGLYCEDCGNDQEFRRMYVVELTEAVDSEGRIGETLLEEEFQDGCYYAVWCASCGSEHINLERSIEA